MRPGWYLARLRNMSFGEVLHRLRERQRQAWSRRRHEGWTRFSAGPVPMALPGLRTALLAAPECHAAIGAAAAEIMAGKFSALGLDWPARDPGDVFASSLWSLSPDTGQTWPSERYCFDIDYREASGVGDIKYGWEINRLHLLQPLAAQMALGGGGAERAAIEQAIASWHGANPPFRGIGWASGIEVGLRAISLLLVLSLCGDQLSAATLARIGAILRASAFWLVRYPSQFSSANNHLMAELAGRYVIAMALEDSASARSAQAEIEREILLQFLPDGVGAEQSPTYGAFSAELGLLCALVAQNAGTPFAVATTDRLSQFADFVFWLARPDGSVPAIGDDDEGRAITLCQPEPGYAAAVAVAIRGLLGQAAPLAAPPGLRSALFPAPAGVAAVLSGGRTFAAGGYSIWRGRHAGGEVGFGFDHGPLGYLSIAAHGHADALSVWLDLDGQPVLVDPSTFRYQAGGAWRDWFRSTRAHNTLTLAGTGQSVASGPFNWSHKAVARLDAAAAHPWRITASHDGYHRGFGVRHQRSVTLMEEGLTIADCLLGATTPLACELSFQLAADLQARIEGNSVAVTRAGRPVCGLILPTDNLRIVNAGGPEQGGWVSTRFGHKQAADRIVWSGAVGADGVTSSIRFAGGKRRNRSHFID